MPAIGSRIQVMNGTAHHTAGGLTKSDFKKITTGRGDAKKTRIVPKLKSKVAKENAPPQLKMWRDSLKQCGEQRKGEFNAVRKGTAEYREVKKVYTAKLKKAGLA